MATKDRPVTKKINFEKAPISEKIAKARREKRTQQALELARAHFKDEPTDAHRELLRQVTWRGHDLQVAGKLQDAAVVFANALASAGRRTIRHAIAARSLRAVAQEWPRSKLPEAALENAQSHYRRCSLRARRAGVHCRIPCMPHLI